MRHRGKGTDHLDWDVQVERHGRVELDLSTRQLRRLAAVGLLFLVAGVLIVVAGSSVGDRTVGGLATLMGAAFIAASLAQFRRRKHVVVIDRHGVTGRYPLRQERFVPWDEIQDCGVYRVRGTAIVLLAVSAEFEASLLADHQTGGAGRALASASRRLTGTPTIALPAPLDADPEELCTWLTHRAAGSRPA